MQRKPGFPVANCSISMPDSIPILESQNEGEEEPVQRRQQLINFGHAQWGFNNWSWAVSKQDLDFVDPNHKGKFTAGVVAFVSVTVKSLDIHRENIGYATSLAPTKGAAIHRARKCAVTNALRETLLSFGGNVAAELMELDKAEPAHVAAHALVHAPDHENNQNLANKHSEPKNSALNKRKEDMAPTPVPIRSQIALPVPAVPPVSTVPPVTAVAPVPSVPPTIKNAPNPPVAKTHPMPANLPPAANRPPLAANAPRPPAPHAPHVRPNNEGGDEEARAERKRRQRQAQEEFRLKQMMKHHADDKKEENRNSSGFDTLLMAIPTQDIIIEGTGHSEDGKRKSPAPEGGVAKRRGSVSRLDIIKTD